MLEVNKPSLALLRLEQLEARLGARLPDDYREFMLKHNGGKPKPSHFRLANKTGPYSDSLVHWLYSIYDGKLSNLERVNELTVGRMPEELLVIGDDPGGNCICVCLSGPSRGKVFFWDHEHETDNPDWSNIHLIADSFDAFMAGLHE